MLLWPSPTQATDCIPEPASQWAPAGWICPPLYGEGTASTWGGPGAARNDCVYPWLRCSPLVVTSLDTGRSIVLTPTTWCMCWVGVTGPNGETARIIDLDPSQVAALGLDASRGLFRVSVEPATVVLPDTRLSASGATVHEVVVAVVTQRQDANERSGTDLGGYPFARRSLHWAIA